MYLFLYLAKIIKSSPEDKLIVITIAVTTHEALKAYAKLKDEGIYLVIQALISEFLIFSHLNQLMLRD